MSSLADGWAGQTEFGGTAPVGVDSSGSRREVVPIA
jgi:hypothetical protein